MWHVLAGIAVVLIAGAVFGGHGANRVPYWGYQLTVWKRDDGRWEWRVFDPKGQLFEANHDVELDERRTEADVLAELKRRIDEVVHA